ncbi:MAG TPA: FeoA family protein [Acidobacteriota bacterium]|nr:FeoA family protein [Acidobacteriota bacterium]
MTTESGVKLTELRPGEKAKLLFMTPEVELRLFGFGLFPGIEIEMIQRFPSYIIRCEQTEIALETSVASQVTVSKPTI